MRIGTYGILIAFGLFILLLILNPRISCFGKRLRSPLYPMLRKRQKKARSQVKTEDYGFHLVDGQTPKSAPGKVGEKEEPDKKKTDDYGFRLN
jgi:hypothetical protein